MAIRWTVKDVDTKMQKALVPQTNAGLIEQLKLRAQEIPKGQRYPMRPIEGLE